MTATVDDHDVRLADGRTVSVAEYGDPDGHPVLHLHGAGSCRFEAEAFDAAARGRGVRIIALDRPGVGRSTAQPLPTLAAYAHDVGGVADALGLDRFTVSGFSNGGMFALACAQVLGDRVDKAVPINPTSPFWDPAVTPELPRSARLAYALMKRSPERIVRMTLKGGILQEGLAARLSHDRAVLRRPETVDVLTRVDAEPRSADCLTRELVLTCEPWGFDHLAVHQPVEFFTGERDAGCRYAARWVAALPDARLHRFPGGHIGYFAPAAADAVAERLAAA